MAFYYSDALFQATKEAGASEDPAVAALCLTLSTALSAQLSTTQQKDPFSPQASGPLWRTPIPDDLTKGEVEQLTFLSEFIEDPEIRARLADIGWIRSRDSALRDKAIEAYILSAVRLMETEHWPGFCKRLERAYFLSSRSRNKHFFRTRITVAVENLAQSPYERDNAKGLQALRFLTVHGLGNAEIHLVLAKNLLKAASSCGDPYEVSIYTNFLHFIFSERGLASSSGQFPRIRVIALLRLAKAKRALQNPQITYERDLKDSIRILDQELSRPLFVKVLISHLKHLRREYINQLKAGGFASSYRVTVKAPETNNMSTMELADYLRTAVLPLSFGQLVTIAKANISADPLLALVEKHTSDEDGAIAANFPHCVVSEIETVFASGKLDWQLFRFYEQKLMEFYAVLEATRQTLINRSDSEREEFVHLLSSSEHVQQDRRSLIELSAELWMSGRSDGAVCILIPQLEQVLRSIAEGDENKPVPRKKLEHEIHLHAILESKAIQERLGEPMIFLLRHLLIDEVGYNIRNRVCHGLVSGSDLNGIYVGAVIAVTFSILLSSTQTPQTSY